MARLRHGGGEHIEAAGIRAAAFQAGKFFIESLGIRARELSYAPHAERAKGADGCGADGDKVAKLAVVFLPARLRILTVK